MGPPAGFSYFPGFLTSAEEADLLARLSTLEYEKIVMRDVEAKRRTIHYGWLYGYESWTLTPGPAVPPFLEPLRARAAALIGAAAEALEEALVTVYPPGAGIGWHRDAPMFGPAVVGVSLGAPCVMRFRPGSAGRTAFEARLEPRSAYVLAGEARTRWQHHIPRADGLRYSVTFRTLARRKSPIIAP